MVVLFFLAGAVRLYRLHAPGLLIERKLSIEQRLDALDFSPEYFVITDFDEFRNNHIDLKEYLADSCVLVAENAEYLIYSTCTQQ